MLIITTPGRNFLPEYTYLARLIFQEWLGVDYALKVGNQGKWGISYLDYEVSFPNIFFPEHNPDIFLDGKRLQNNLNAYTLDEYGITLPFADGGGKILEDADIFGSIFYFITCFEDTFFDRCEFNGTLAPRDSFAYQNGLLKRPFIDEIIVSLSQFLFKHNIPTIVREPKYQLIYSCDIDVPALWYKSSFYRLVKPCIGAIIKHQSLKRLYSILNAQAEITRDAAYTFPWIAAELEKNSLTGCFNLKGGQTHKKFDFYYDPRTRWMQDIINLLTNSGHEIGFHPSYSTPEKPEDFMRELSIVQKASQVTILGGRQHYLRFLGSSTWRMWDNSGLVYDSTVAFNKSSGFKIGTAHEFPVYDILSRKELQLRERPLIAMDVTLLGYEGLTSQEAFDNTYKYSQQIRKYGGNMTLLWHNSNLDSPEKKELFSQMLKYLA